jgi:hypothetical protein
MRADVMPMAAFPQLDHPCRKNDFAFYRAQKISRRSKSNSESVDFSAKS